MQKITIEVKDDYVNNIIAVLQGLKGVIVDKIKLDDMAIKESDSKGMIALQQDVMEQVWDNDEDKAWDAV
jgi:translation elongation factor EF-G